MDTAFWGASPGAHELPPAVAPRLRMIACRKPAERLKQARERLNLRYRDVEQASIRIAEMRHNEEFSIALSRLSDIENKGTVPTIYRLYSLCAIYRLDMSDVLEWYGVDLAVLPADAAALPVESTHLLGFGPGLHGEVQVPLVVEPGGGSKQNHLSEPRHPSLGQTPALLAECRGSQASPLCVRGLGGLVHVPDPAAGRSSPDR